MSQIPPTARGLPAALHPELVRLQAEYDHVVDDFEAGHLTLEQAQATLGALGVIDANGCKWGVDDEGRFTRRENPEQPPTVVNPALFAAARAPVAPGVPLAPWEDPALAQPRVAPPMMPMGEMAPRRASRTRRPAGTVRLTDKVMGSFDTHRRTVAVVAVCVALLVGVVLTSGGDDNKPSTTLPGTSSPQVTVTVDTTDSTDTSVATTQTTMASTTTTIPVVAPTPDEAGRVISALSSGNRDLAVAELVKTGTVAEAAMQTAFYAGLSPTGLGLIPGAAVLADDETAAQSWRLVEEATGDELAVLTVKWERVGKTWKLASWPTPAGS